MNTKRHIIIAMLGLMMIVTSCNPEAKKDEKQAGSVSSVTTETSKADDLYPITVNGKTGFIDANGKVVVEPKFDYTVLPTLNFNLFFEGMKNANANTDILSYFNGGLAMVVDIPYPKFLNKDSGSIKLKWGIIDKTGNYVYKSGREIDFKEIYNFIDFSEELIPFKGDEDKFGYVDKTIKFVIEPQFDEAFCFSEGLAAVKIDDKVGYIDKAGKLVIEPQFDEANSFSNGVARVVVNEKTGFIDKTGKYVVTPQFDDVSFWGFQEDMLLVKEGKGREGKWGFVDKSGKIIVEPQFDDAFSFSDGLALVMVGNRGNEKWGYIDKNGTVVIEPQFDYANKFHDGFAEVRINGKTGFIDKTGKMVIGAEYDGAKDFSEGLAAVEVDDKWGYVDKTGKMVIKPQFDEAFAFSEGVAEVVIKGEKPWDNDNWDESRYFEEFEWEQGKRGFIDKTGEYIINPRFNGVYSNEFGGGFYLVSEGGNWVLNDDHGPKLVNEKWGIVSKNGKILAEPQFDEKPLFLNGEIGLAMKDGKCHYINNQGKIIWTLEEISLLMLVK